MERLRDKKQRAKEAEGKGKVFGIQVR